MTDKVIPKWRSALLAQTDRRTTDKVIPKWRSALLAPQKRRPKTGFKNINLFHDNAPAHKSKIVTEVLRSERVTVLPHPPYSPDLAPCDFFSFSKS